MSLIQYSITYTQDKIFLYSWTYSLIWITVWHYAANNTSRGHLWWCQAQCDVLNHFVSSILNLDGFFMSSRYIFWHQKIVINKPISDKYDKIVTKQQFVFFIRPNFLYEFKKDISSRFLWKFWDEISNTNSPNVPKGLTFVPN